VYYLVKCENNVSFLWMHKEYYDHATDVKLMETYLRPKPQLVGSSTNI
jgi:DNA-directed RNA polymerase